MSDIYIGIFDNYIEVHAPFDAQRLMETLGLEVPYRLPRRRRVRA